MEHFQDADWVDYVRGLTSGAQTADMAAHLATGCERCGRLARALRETARVGLEDAHDTPPEHVVHAARAIFARWRPDRAPWMARLATVLVYDSAISPLPVGVRCGLPVTRQVLYEAGPYSIDLRLDRERGSRHISLTGQIASAEPARRVERLAVLLISGEAVAAQAITNGNGEFQFEYPPQHQLQLRIDVQADEPIEIPLCQHEGRHAPEGGRR